VRRMRWGGRALAIAVARTPIMLVTGTGAGGDEAYAIGKGALDHYGAVLDGAGGLTQSRYEDEPKVTREPPLRAWVKRRAR
jgi:hypothetical protein